MKIVMDFDGVFTDPSAEGDACQAGFRDKILSLSIPDLQEPAQVDSWMGELRVRMGSRPFQYGWRSEGRISAFSFEDPFIRNIGLADFLDQACADGDARAKKVLGYLAKKDAITSFGDLSAWVFQQLKLKKHADRSALEWVRNAIEKGHEVTIVSNSATDKIDEFLSQNGFGLTSRPQVRGGAQKFALGAKTASTKKETLMVLQDAEFGPIEVDTNRPVYEKALMEVQPDAIIGDVFSLDLSLPVKLKRQGKLAFSHGIYYRLRDYTPNRLLDAFGAKSRSLVPEVTPIREWSQFKI
jgi:hypothetical protein